jgi:hypothetical protein
MTTKKYVFIRFFASDFLKLHIHYFSKTKVIKKSQNRRNQDLSYYFCLMIEGSGTGSGGESGADPYFVLMDPALDPGGPKTYRSGNQDCILRLWHWQSGALTTTRTDLNLLNKVLFCLSRKILQQETRYLEFKHKSVRYTYLNKIPMRLSVQNLCPKSEFNWGQ